MMVHETPVRTLLRAGVSLCDTKDVVGITCVGNMGT